MQLSGRLELQALRRRAVAGDRRAAARAGGQLPDPLDGPLAAWLAQLPSAALEEAETVETLVYRLDRPRSAGRSFTLEARIVRPLKSGRLGAGRSCSLADLHTEPGALCRAGGPA